MTDNSSPAPTGPKLAVVLSHATQYYSPWFRWMKSHAALNLRVFYLSDAGMKPALDEKFNTRFAWDTDLTSGYEWEIVPNRARNPNVLRFSGLNNPELLPRIAAWAPEAVLVFGYNYNTHIKFILQAGAQHLPLIFRGDSHLLGRGRLSWFKRFLLRSLYGRFSAVTYVGRSNIEYFRQLGVPAEKLFFCPHAVDADHFSITKTEYKEKAVALRTKLGLRPETRVVLFAGKLIPLKQPHALLESFIQLGFSDTALVFVGDGEEKASLQARAASRPDVSVHFLPFANQSEMPVLYRMADLFALPSSSETWGLSVNEAMHLGLPCLVSDHVGCQADLVTDRETGWVFRSGDPVNLRSKLNEALAALEFDRHALRSAVLERISSYTYEQATAGLLQALAFARKSS